MEKSKCKITRKIKKDYLDAGGIGCLFCGGDDISGGFIEIEGDRAYQKISCAVCGGEWHDVYKLVNVIEA